MKFVMSLCVLVVFDVAKTLLLGHLLELPIDFGLLRRSKVVLVLEFI